MCKIMEELSIESELRARYQTAVRLIKMELLPLEKIAEGTDLPLETIKELAEKCKGKMA